jgi:shikimate kinase
MNAMSNLILIGPMGAGKTTNGKWLARQLGKTFIDMDAYIEQKTGTGITHIFELEGEAGFRQREAAALAEILANENQVIATGGGSILLDANRELMKRRGLVLYMHIPPEMQLQRLLNDRKRPLLQTGDRAERLQQLAAVRTPIYQSCADIKIDISRMPMSQIRPHLLQTLLNHGMSNNHHA